MNDELRAKSTTSTQESGTRPLVSPPAYIACMTCSTRATFDSDWQPGKGIEQSLYRFTCKLGHHSYRAIKYRFKR